MNRDLSDRRHPVSRIHREVIQLAGWGTVRNDDPAWYSSALTRIALLLGDDEAKLILGDTGKRSLLCLTPNLAILAVADADDATVTAVPRSALTALYLDGGASAFPTSWPSDWPGDLSVTLQYGSNAQITLALDGYGWERLFPMWPELLNDLKA